MATSPVTNVEYQPLNGRRLEPTKSAQPDWPVFGGPQSAPERTAATQCLFQRLGLDHQWVPGVPLWRARALLRTWWDAGACPAALLHAIDHHPDRPDHHRGDALRGSRDPLRVLGARLCPWRGRLHELPARLAGLPGDYRAATTARGLSRRRPPRQAGRGPPDPMPTAQLWLRGDIPRPAPRATCPRWRPVRSAAELTRPHGPAGAAGPALITSTIYRGKSSTCGPGRPFLLISGTRVAPSEVPSASATPLRRPGSTRSRGPSCL